MPLKGVDNVKKAIAKTKKKANNSLLKIYFSGLSRIIRETPTDTGRAKNSWFLTSGSSFSLLSGRDSNKGGEGSLGSLSEIPKNVLGKKIFFTNNLPYIGVLEYGGYPNPVKEGSYNKKNKSFEILSISGFSKQAPGGWVRSNLIIMQNKIRQL